MKVGKLDTDLLREIVFKNITYHRDEVMVRPSIGEDCAVIDFGEYACVLSTDPITGTANEVGRLAVHISCNDVASNGVEPLGLLLTIMAPEGTTVEEIDFIMKQAGEAAAQLNVEIIGGHTEITSAVNRVVVSSTAIGRQKKERVVKTKGAKVGDHILMTKCAGLEGTGILAYEMEEKLQQSLGSEIVDRAKALLDKISVVPEGIVGGTIGATSMHDITEGGLFGALWEMCEASKVGAVLYKDKIHITEETQKICDFFQIDPLRLISSGCMLMTIDAERVDVLLAGLRTENIEVHVIGEIVSQGRYLVDGEKRIQIAPPESDELYKVLV